MGVADYVHGKEQGWMSLGSRTAEKEKERWHRRGVRKGGENVGHRDIIKKMQSREKESRKSKDDKMGGGKEEKRI